VQRLKVGGKPSHMAFSPDSQAVHVTLQSAGTVLAISLETGEPLWQAEVGPDPAGILWHDLPGAGPRLLVGIMGSDHFAVLDPATRQVERVIPVGRGAHTVFRAPDGGMLWATSRVDSRVTALDPTTLEPRGVFDIPGGPDDLAFDPDGRVWMTLRWAARAAVLEPATGHLTTVRVGRSPHGIFLHPRRGDTAVARAASPWQPAVAAGQGSAGPLPVSYPAPQQGNAAPRR
jgi:DNA-binding beta-propeller fold protein YncE